MLQRVRSKVEIRMYSPDVLDFAHVTKKNNHKVYSQCEYFKALVKDLAIRCRLLFGVCMFHS